MQDFPYYLGAPLWSVPEWKGRFYSPTTKAGDFLSEYSKFFNAVEGNTTFYATPSEANVARWAEATPDHFRFSFKFPRDITHDKKLQNVELDTEAFLKRMSPLGQKLNNFMVQLPASFSPSMLNRLDEFLESLPKIYGYAVEVRHPDFFINPEVRAALNEVVKKHAVDRVIFDSRPVHSAAPVDQATQDARRKKPRLPVQLDVTGQQPMLRYIGHPMLEENQRWLEPWAAQTVRWLQAGLKPYIYLHTPSNVMVPELALTFHGWVKQRMPEFPDLPSFPSP